MTGAGPPRGAIARLATVLALAGGVALLGVALLTTASVLRRWAGAGPVTGDVEMVQLGGGLAVLGFLAHGTLMRANIMVDSFTARLPRRLTRAMDGFWSLLWAAVALVLAERMAVGAAEALANRTTTIGLLGLPLWWALGLGALGFAATGLTALLWGGRLLGDRG